MTDPVKIILNEEQIALTIKRLSMQIIENHIDFNKLCIIGIQEKGVLLSERLIQTLMSMTPEASAIKYGKLDITFYRDDFRRRAIPLKASSTHIEFLVEGMEVLLIDDVLYSGRTVHAAMSALLDFGRPASVELLVLVDRRFNRKFPVQANYIGISVDALQEAYVKVMWREVEGQDQVNFYPGSENL